MKNSQLKFILILALFFSASFLMAQESAHKLLLDGIEAFYSARFEESIRILEQAIESDSLNNDELFSAHIYIAFSFLRQGVGQEIARHHFEQAIKVNPNAVLDQKIIPPDLYEQFEQVRQRLFGNLVVETEPPGASVILIDPVDGRVVNRTTPALFDRLFLQREYKLIVTKDGYVGVNRNVSVTASTTDSMRVILEKKKTFFNRWWAWGSGLAIATAIVIFDMAGKEGTPESKSKELPEPPKRP